MPHPEPSLPDIDWSGETEARLAETGLGEEQVLLVLLRAVRAFAARSAGDADVAPVSVTVDHTARLDPSVPLHFAMVLDRRTRTLVFAHGAAMQGDTQVMTATAVYRIGAEPAA